MKNQEEVFKAVEEAIQEVLNTDEGEIKMESALVKDLGAESIDFLDISCELEKHLNREIDFKELITKVNANNGTEGHDIKVGDLVSHLVG